jgi:hypothetical protein
MNPAAEDLVAVTIPNYFWDHLPAMASAALTIFALFKIQKIHIDINARLDQWRKDTKEAGIAEGRLAGQKEEREKKP